MKKGERTREHIVECAEKAFSEKGYYETQVSDIVKMAHVAKGTIYQYFKNKEDLFLTLLRRYCDTWEDSIALDMTNFMGDGPAINYARSFLRHRMEKTVLFFSENQDRTNIILRMGVGVNEVFEKIIILFEERILKIIVHDIKLGQRQGHIPDDMNVDIAANAILGAIIRLSYFYFVTGKGLYQNLQLQSMMDEMVKLVLRVLKMD